MTAIEARLVDGDPHWLRLRWRIDGAGRLVLPPFAGRRRADGLWRATCFELFLRGQGRGGYVELNLSPSERWAAYDFAGYRAGQADRAMPHPPCCTIRPGRGTTLFDAAVPLAGLPPPPWRAGLCAVIEEEGGRLSYWALAHPPGRPDFHDPACFVLDWPAPAGS